MRNFIETYLGKPNIATDHTDAFSSKPLKAQINNELSKELSVYFYTINHKASSDMDYKECIKTSLNNLSRVLLYQYINLIRSLSRELNRCLLGKQQYINLSAALIASYITELSDASYNLARQLESNWDEWYVTMELLWAIVIFHTVTKIPNITHLYPYGLTDFREFLPDLESIITKYI